MVDVTDIPKSELGTEVVLLWVNEGIGIRRCCQSPCYTMWNH